MATVTRINGNIYSWSSLEIVGHGVPLADVTAIDYEDGLEPGLPRGTSSVPVGATRGQWSASCSIEMLRHQFESLKLALGPGFADVDSIVNVSYFEPLLGVVMDTILLRFSKANTSNTDSNDGTKVRITCTVLQPILWNGIPCVLPG